jgi:1-phosphatidylinositol phosphodiesterase
MADIRDDVLLSEMALPGTHDSGTYDKHIESVITQTLNFNQQLDYGIRVFDIRIRHIGNSFALHHGPVFLNVMFKDFLDAANDFLDKNPSETILFRLKEEHDPENNTRSLKDTLEYYLSSYGHHYLQTTNKDITLGEARGKFIILSNNANFNDYGLNYTTFNIQDNYNLKTNWDLHDVKWSSIKSQISRAIGGDKKTFYINYLSGSGGSLPYFVASGHSSPGTGAPRLSTGLTTPGWKNSYPDFPRVSCFIGFCTIAFEGTNILTRDRLSSYNILLYLLWSLGGTAEINDPILSLAGIKRTAGIIMADFPGESLISNIIDNNYLLRKPENVAREPYIENYADTHAMDQDILAELQNSHPEVLEALQEKLMEIKQQSPDDLPNQQRVNE